MASMTSGRTCALLVAMLGLAGCGGSPPPSNDCLTDADCTAGDMCLFAACIPRQPDAAVIDAGPVVDAATGDVGACALDGDCAPASFCRGGTCAPCDADADGFVASDLGVASCLTLPHTDCDDSDASVHPGAVPVCGNEVDETCDLGTRFLPSLSEVSLLAPVELAMAERLGRGDEVSIAVTSSRRAVLFTHQDDTQRSPLATEVDLAAGVLEPPVPLDVWGGGEPLVAAPGTGIYTALEHREDGRVRVAEIHATSTSRLRTALWTIDGDAPVTRASNLEIYLDAFGLDGWRPQAAPLFAHSLSPDGWVTPWWAVFSAVPGPAGIYVLPGTDIVAPVAIDDRVFSDPTAVRASNSARFGLFTVEGTADYYVWNGEVDAPAAAPRGTLWAGLAGTVIAPGAIATLDPGGARGGPYALVALPMATGIGLHLLTCGPARAECSHLSTASLPVPGPSTRGIALASVSDSEVAFLVSDGDSADGLRVGLWNLYDDASGSWVIPGGVDATPVATPGSGVLTALALDVVATSRDTSVSPPVTGITLAYAYVRRAPVGGSTHVGVGGFHACVDAAP